MFETQREGGTPLQSVLQAVTAVKILTKYFYRSIMLILRLWVLRLKIHLTFDGLTIDYGEYLKHC